MEFQLLIKKDITPIFVVGSARSGTTMIGKLLFSSEDCYKYTAETLLLTVCRKRYGDIFQPGSSKAEFLSDWFRSRQFRRANLDKDEFLSLFEKSNSPEFR
ncbi:sulfotransferase [Salinimonas iocasae]|uniref:Sulfotransferase n=1 Tax=Salinimonas iocasae TaxID=2572577 RepID=A0A5B7YBP2_9ALTE|nr:sulfotransferase [Salinimonas iocasae]QCZ92930.1 sulfotransferase [Salinimonas iocasae]